MEPRYHSSYGSESALTPFEDYIKTQLEHVTQQLQTEYRRLHTASSQRLTLNFSNEDLSIESPLNSGAAATVGPAHKDQNPLQENRGFSSPPTPHSPSERTMVRTPRSLGLDYIVLPSQGAERGAFKTNLQTIYSQGRPKPSRSWTPMHEIGASTKTPTRLSTPMRLSTASGQELCHSMSEHRSTVSTLNRSTSAHSVVSRLSLENDRTKCCWEYWTLHPNNRFYRAWSHFISSLVIVDCILTPLHLAFVEDFEHVAILETLLDILFAIDIVLAFNVAYVSKTALHTSRCDIAYHYVHSSRFWIALVASVPFDSLYLMVSSTQGVDVHISAMLSLLRLLRINHLNILFHDLQKNTSFNLLGVVVTKFFLFILLCTHTSGCIFYALARMNNFDETTWVTSLNDYLPDKHLATRYVHALFWAVSTFKAGPAHSSISPASNTEMILAISTMMVNICLQTYLVSNMAALLTRSDVRTYAFRKDMGQLNDFFSRHSLPKDLRDQLKAYLAFKFRTSQELDQMVLSSFPELYRQRISHELYEHVVAQIDLFRDCQQRFLFQLHSSLTTTLHMPLQCLAVTDEPCTSLQILAEGMVELLARGHSVDFCRTGESYSAVPFLCKVGYTLTVQTRKFCRVLSVDHVSWNNACAAYPENLNQVKVNLLEECTEKSNAFEEDSPGNLAYDELASIVRANLVQQCEMGIALMSAAASRGDVNELKRLLVGLTPNCANCDSRTPLHAAAANGQVDSIRILLEQSAQVDPIDNFGRTPLLDACQAHHEESASELFLHNADVGGQRKRRIRNPEHGDPTTYLHPESEESMIDEEWDTNVIPSELCKAAASSDRAWYLKALLRYRANPNEWDHDRRTPLHVACASNNATAVKIFATNPLVELASVDQFGQTPLMVAVRLGHEESAAILKERGAPHGYCLDIRARKDPFEVSASQELCNAVCANELAFLKRLINYCGLPVDVRDLDLRTPLMVSCHIGNMDAAILLVQNGADINLIDRFGTTPIQEARNRNHSHLVEVLKAAHEEKIARGSTNL